MKKQVLIRIKITAILYFIIYLIAVFINWDLFNPFEWILNIPKWDNEDRASLLCAFITYQIFLFPVIGIYDDIKKQKTKNPSI